MRSATIARALALACALALVIPSALWAITWGPVRPITVSGQAAAWNGAMSVTGTKAVQLVYREWDSSGHAAVLFRRSTDGGTTWKAPVKLSGGVAGTVPGIASSGSILDVVWRQYRSNGSTAVMYRTSTDAGVSWGPGRALATFSGESGTLPAVTRDAAGRVVITWVDTTTGKVKARVSTNGGATFGPTRVLATTTNQPYDGETMYEGFPTVAIANAVINVAYYTDADTLVLRRSTDGGATWKSPQVLANNGSGWRPHLAAKGRIVLVGYARYTGSDIWTVYRRSTNSGATWSSVTALSPASAAPSYQPLISNRGGAWRVAFERCTAADCASSGTFYRQSLDGGVTWSTVSRVSPRSVVYSAPVGVDRAGGKAVTAYLVYNPDTETEDIHLRQGT